MRTRTQLSAAGTAALVAVTMLSTDARAEEPKQIDLGIFLGAHIFNDDNELGSFDLPDADSPSNALMGGVRVGYRINDTFSAEGELAVIPTEARIGAADLTAFGFRLQGLAHLDVGIPELRPFALVGTSVMTLSSSDDNVLEDDSDWIGLHAGGGVKYEINAKTGVRGDVRLLFPPSSANEAVTVDFEVTVGVFRTFDLGGGGTAGPPPPAPKPPTDDDGDGIVGDADKCPDKAEDKDGFQDDDGCPDLDNDGDGIPDGEDQCPNEAETVNDVADADGCPETDEDNDGILSALDQCPDKAEDLDGHQDEDGCPDLDNDGDGIDDKIDQCPNKPETENGYEDADGCPDVVPAKVKKFTGAIKGIQFANGKANLRRTSYKTLNAAVKVLQEYKELKLEIQGHTDSKGTDEKNRILSQARANIVKAYLVKKGIDDARLTAVGYGETVPVADNSKASGRKQNRRVEFKLIN